MKNKFVKKQNIHEPRPFLIDAIKVQQNCLTLVLGCYVVDQKHKASQCMYRYNLALVPFDGSQRKHETKPIF